MGTLKNFLYWCCESYAEAAPPSWIALEDTGNNHAIANRDAAPFPATAAIPKPDKARLN